MIILKVITKILFKLLQLKQFIFEPFMGYRYIVYVIRYYNIYVV